MSKVIAIAVVTICVTSGCGTMINLQDGCITSQGTLPAPFGGVRNDLTALSIPVPLRALYLADLPLSVMGDIVTLPLVLSKSEPNSSKEPKVTAKDGGLSENEPPATRE